MRWISDLSPAYSRYAAAFLGGFDSFEPVQCNPKLGPILEEVPYPRSLPSPPELELLGVPALRDGIAPPPSLDQLFMLPICRLGYYKKLYSRLLRSTKEGRSDHQLLVSSNKAILGLLEACEAGRQRSVLPGGESMTEVEEAELLSLTPKEQGSPLPAFPQEETEVEQSSEAEALDRQLEEHRLQAARLEALVLEEPVLEQPKEVQETGDARGFTDSSASRQV